MDELRSCEECVHKKVCSIRDKNVENASYIIQRTTNLASMTDKISAMIALFCYHYDKKPEKNDE